MRSEPISLEALLKPSEGDIYEADKSELAYLQQQAEVNFYHHPMTNRTLSGNFPFQN